MTRLTRLIGVVLTMVAFLLGAYTWVEHRGYARGAEASEARHKAQVAAVQWELDKAAASLRTSTVDLERYRDAARILAQGVEDETRADVDVCRVPKPTSVQRLQRRWGVPH